jgi:hypothetical protein
MSDPHPDPPTITPEDLTALNQRALLRSIDLVRRASTVLLVLAGTIGLAWLWSTLRSQGLIGTDDDGFTPVFTGEDLSVKDRIDFLAATLYSLGTASAVAGIGLGIRLYCDVATLRAGGSLTGWEVGDSIEPEVVELDQA